MSVLAQNMARRGRMAWFFEWAAFCGLRDDQEAVAHDVLEESGTKALLEWVRAWASTLMAMRCLQWG